MTRSRFVLRTYCTLLTVTVSIVRYDLTIRTLRVSYVPYLTVVTSSRSKVSTEYVSYYVESKSTFSFHLSKRLINSIANASMPLKFNKEVSSHLFKYIQKIDVKFNREFVKVNANALKLQSRLTRIFFCVEFISVRQSGNISKRIDATSPSQEVCCGQSEA